MRLFTKLLDLIYPPRCIFCHCLLDSGTICETCAASLPVLDREARQQSFDGIRTCSSLFPYEGNIRESLLRYKFHGLSFYGEDYARLMLLHFTLEETECDLISWVPLSRRRLRQRGYDQARLLAQRLSEYLGLPCERVLKKVKNVAPQSRTGGPEARKKNISGAYRLARKADVRGKTVLLVDDIVTTGSTLSECAAVLREAGAAEVKALTVARTKTDRSD